MLPPHIITALLKWALVTNEKMASPLDHDPKLPQYYHIIHGNFRAHENTMYLATRHAIYSAALSTEATATFMFLPSWNKRMTPNPHTSLNRRFPRICKFLSSIPSDQLQYAPICRNTLLEKYTDAPSQTNLQDAHHCHMEYKRQILPQCLQQELAKRACQRNF